VNRDRVRTIALRLRSNWGFWYFALLSVITLTQLFDPSRRGHYHAFTSAGHAVASAAPSYMTDFSWNTGLYWFYSPTCALMVYYPFSLLPETVGLILHVFLMWSVFVAGVLFAVRSIEKLKISQFTPVQPMSINLFWFFITSEMIGAIASQKLEILMTGMIFFSLGLLLRQRYLLASLLLALATNWKFQPIPLVGLLVLGEILARRFQFFLGFLGFSIAAFLFPFAVLPFGYINITNNDWFRAVDYQLVSQWLNFDHLFGFAMKILRFSFDLSEVKVLGVLIGGLFLAFQLWYVSWVQHFLSRGREIIFSGILATFFITSLSPLSQSNGYILVAPLVLFATSLAFRAPFEFRKLEVAAVLGGWVLTSVLSSDLVPKATRLFFSENAFKSLGPLVLATYCLWCMLRSDLVARRRS
jgi:hypothetical protein